MTFAEFLRKLKEEQKKQNAEIAKSVSTDISVFKNSPKLDTSAYDKKKTEQQKAQQDFKVKNLFEKGLAVNEKTGQIANAAKIRNQARTDAVINLYNSDVSKNSDYDTVRKLGKDSNAYRNMSRLEDVVTYAEQYENNFGKNYLTEGIKNISEKEMNTLDYYSGLYEQGKIKKQTLNDLEDYIEYQTQQRYEDQRLIDEDINSEGIKAYPQALMRGIEQYALGDVDLIRRLTGNIAPSVESAEQKAFQKEIENSTGKRQRLLQHINSAGYIAPAVATAILTGGGSLAAEGAETALKTAGKEAAENLIEKQVVKSAGKQAAKKTVQETIETSLKNISKEAAQGVVENAVKKTKKLSQILNPERRQAALMGNSAMWASIAGNDYAELRRQGYSDNEALTYAILDASLEFATEYFGGAIFGGINRLTPFKGILKNRLSNISTKPIIQRAIGYVSAMHGEGVEEWTQVFLQPIIKNLSLDNQYTPMDLTPEGGLQAYLSGATMAGVFNSFSFAKGITNDIKTSKINYELSDGTALNANTLNKLFNGGKFTNDEKLQLQNFGDKITDADFDNIINQINNVAEGTVGQYEAAKILEITKDMTPSEKINYYFENLGDIKNLISVKNAKALETVQNEPLNTNISEEKQQGNINTQTESENTPEKVYTSENAIIKAGRTLSNALISKFKKIEVENKAEMTPLEVKMTDANTQEYKNSLNSYLKSIRDLHKNLSKEQLSKKINDDLHKVAQKYFDVEFKPKELADAFKLDARIVATDSGAAISDLDKVIFGKNKEKHTYKFYNYAKNAMAAATSAISNVQSNLYGDAVGKSLNDIFKPIEAKGEEYSNKFSNYLWHKHNIDRFKRGKAIFGNDFTDTQSKAYVTDYEKSNPEFIKHAEELYKFLNNNLQMRVDANCITEKFADFLNEIYEYYVPTLREIKTEEPGTAIDVDKPVISKVEAIPQTIKGAVKNNYPLLDLKTAITRQTMQVYKASYRNMFANKIYDAVYNNKGNDNIGAYVYGVRVLQKSEKPLNTDSIVFYRNGQRLQMMMSKHMHTAFKQLFPKGVDTYAKVFKGLEHVSNTFKKLVTAYNPIFFIKNPIRDFGDALIYTKNPFNEFIATVPKAVKEMKNNSAVFKKYLGSGAFGSTYFDYTQNTGINLAKKGVKRIEMANFYVEQLPRFTEYLATMKTLKPDVAFGKITEFEAHTQAMYNAADITINFNRAGTATKFLNRTFVPFLNPGVQGLSKIARTFAEGNTKKQWVGLVVKAALFSIAPSALNALLNGDEDDWDTISDSVKDTYYLLKTENGYMKIPKGRVAATIAMIPKYIGKTIKGDDVNWGDVLNSIWAQIGAPDPLNDNIFGTLKNAVQNKTWYGGQIENQALQNRKPGERYDETTDYISKFIGSKLNISPKKLNYILDNYSGVIGDFVLPVVTPKTMGGNAGDYLAAPFKKAFSLDPVQSNNLSHKFYKAADDVTYEKNSATSQVGIDFVNRYINKQKSGVSDLYKQINIIENDTTLALKDKNEQIRVLKGSINTIYQNTLDNLPQVKEAAKTYYKGGTDGEIDVQYAQMSKQLFGAEYALKNYNKDVYEKAQTYNKLGVSYDDYYNYYFATKDLDAKRNGKTVTGLKKARVWTAINKMNLPRGQKLMLFAKNYKMSNAESIEIIKYINSKPISKAEKIKILKELDINSKLYK